MPLIDTSCQTIFIGGRIIITLAVIVIRGIGILIGSASSLPGGTVDQIGVKFIGRFLSRTSAGAGRTTGTRRITIIIVRSIIRFMRIIWFLFLFLSLFI